MEECSPDQVEYNWKDNQWGDFCLGCAIKVIYKSWNIFFNPLKQKFIVQL